MASTRRTLFRWTAISALASASWLVLGCNDDPVPCGAGDNCVDPSGTSSGTPPTGTGGTDFVSGKPGGSNDGRGEGEDGAADGNGSSASSGTGTGGGSGGEPPSANPDPEADPERALVEADIIQVHDGKLYALSQYSGLSILGISEQDELELLGRFPVAAIPFEMYLKDGVVYAMFDSYGQSLYDEATNSWSWVQSSRVEALDVSNPASIKALGSFVLPGSISDSRLVGDVLYAVSYENGYCWECSDKPTTTVTSIAVGDPEDIRQVDRLDFDTPDPYGYGWRRSVTATTARLYIAGIEWNGEEEGHSTIQVVDIADPTGLLELGASVEVEGQIESRWQMDEHEGVLRVISQPGLWWTEDVPTVQTFAVESSSTITPLGSLDLVLPMPERLRSVRFDGNRAYAITAEQQDPLFTIDLADPAAPVQRGELEMPGFVWFMEPRGDRVVALGFDNQNQAGSLTVSLFDVSDLNTPTMLDRVNFGGDWANLAEDQDRIHKSFKVLDDEGLVLVPFSGWDYTNYDNYEYYCGSYKSGIQLVDWHDDQLVRRGVAETRGQARRAFLFDERLFAVSDEQVRTFDIADRGHPAQKAQLGLATTVNQAHRAGDVVVRAAADWWTSEPRLEVVPADDPNRAEPLGTLSLEALGEASPAYEGCYGSNFWGLRTFVTGSVAILAWPAADYQQTVVATVDVSVPSKPTVIDSKTFPFPMDYYGWAYGYDGTIAGGESVSMVGTSLVFRNVSYDYQYNPIDPNQPPYVLTKANLEVVDFTAGLLDRTTIPLPEGQGYGLFQVRDGVLYSSHYENVEGGLARFFVDRWSFALPGAPQALPSINVPGSLLAVGEDGHKFVTMDYAETVVPNILPDACYQQHGYFEWPTVSTGTSGDYYPYDYNTPGTCRIVHRTVKLVTVDAAGAHLRDQHPLDDGAYPSYVVVGDDRVFLSKGYWYDYAEDGSSSTWRGGYLIFGFDGDELETAEFTTPAGSYDYPLAAAGKRLLSSDYASAPRLLVLDATDLDAVTLEPKAELEGWWVNHVSVDGDEALCSMGQFGVKRVRLD